MTGLLLPRHQAAALARSKAEVSQRDASTASAISTRSTNAMLASDDFVSVHDVKDQLAKLDAYIRDRRENQPDYTLPKPSGWKLMLLILTIPDETAGGLILIDDSKEAKSLASPQGVILDMGPAAYTDANRFSVHGELSPWHERGDRISFVRYDAAMFQLSNGQRLGFLNDTQPVARIDRGWELPC
jgi:hypothetical protein